MYKLSATLPRSLEPRRRAVLPLRRSWPFVELLSLKLAVPAKVVVALVVTLVGRLNSGHVRVRFLISGVPRLCSVRKLHERHPVNRLQNPEASVSPRDIFSPCRRVLGVFSPRSARSRSDRRAGGCGLVTRVRLGPLERAQGVAGLVCEWFLNTRTEHFHTVN